VLLTSDPGAPDRQVELTADNCVGEIQRSASEVGDTASGYWCDNGVYVHIAGAKAYVDHALATLRVKVTASTPPERAS